MADLRAQLQKLATYTGQLAELLEHYIHASGALAMSVQALNATVESHHRHLLGDLAAIEGEPRP